MPTPRSDVRHAAPARRALHIGAHRTGTTALQQFMRVHEKTLSAAGCQVVYPPKSRNRGLPPLQDGPTVISEENFLGGMGGCVLAREPYPDAAQRLRKLPEPLKAADTVYLSIRSLDEWWSSVMAFGVKMGRPLPKPDAVDAMSRARRSWTDVVDDIRSALPDARVVVRDAGFCADDPAEQLKRLTGWAVWDGLPVQRRVHNRRPDVQAMARTLLARADFGSLARLPEEGDFAPFDAAQTDRLRRRYEADISRLAADERIEFWCVDADTTPAP